MYRVLIVDDEPPFIRIIKKMICAGSERFMVVGEAFNGIEALDLVPQVRPDVIFTDIKMPGMDGISLLKKVNEQYPQILPVIVSGYKDFEYAKEALKTGALEYILKPINPQMMSEVLENLSIKLQRVYRGRELELLLSIASNKHEATGDIKHFFTYRGYMTVMVRTGALGNRHSIPLLLQQEQPFEGVDFEVLSQKCAVERFWVLPGSDENEKVLLAASGENDARPPKQIFTFAFKELEQQLGNITMVFGPRFFDVNQLPLYLEPLKRMLNQCLVIGRSQLLDCNDISALPEATLPILDKTTENKLLVLMETKSLKLLKSEMYKLFSEWEEKAYPQVWVEKMLKQIMMLVEKQSPAISTSISLNLEQQLQEVTSISTSFGELMKAVWDIIEEIFGNGESNSSENGPTGLVVEKVDTYIKTNLAESLTLQSVCKVFGISQPYLSRLFRRYKNMSFNEYVTGIKIAKAREIMAEYPGMLLKDVAEVVGFRDQYYFSKIFKYVTGVNPSDYKSECTK